MRRLRHGSASRLVNLFLFSPPGNRSYLRELCVQPNFRFTRGIAERKVRRPRYLLQRFRMRDQPNVYPWRFHLKHFWNVFVLQIDLSNLLPRNTIG